MGVRQMEFVRSPTQSWPDVLGIASLKRTAVAFYVVVLCGGCVSTGELPEHATIQGPLPQNVRSVVIQAMPMKPGTIKNVEKLTLADGPPLFTGYLKDALVLKQPSWQIKLADGEEATSYQDLVMNTELLE